MSAFFSVVSRDSCQLFSKQSKALLQTLPIVKASDDHRSFIISTWVKSYESHCRKLRLVAQPGPIGADLRIDPKAYRAGESRAAERYWAESHVLLGSEADAYTIHGWVCAVPGRLWHVYVPPGLREAGVAGGLAAVFAGSHYNVSKPWPNQPRGHTCSYDPWMSLPL